MSHCVHIVFYKHLTNWLLYGHLEDMYNEFFIQKISEKQNNLMLVHNKDNFADKINTKFSTDMWNYDVQIDMLPSYIRPSLATKILTIGQTIIMFGNDPRQKKGNLYFKNFKLHKILNKFILFVYRFCYG